MFRTLEIENLKSLGGKHSIPLAPITLIYGPNSAGKSSILSALGLLKQTLNPSLSINDPTAPQLNLRGDVVDLGSFGAAVHNHDLANNLSIGVELTRQATDPRRRGVVKGDHYVGLGFRFDGRTDAVRHRDVVIGGSESKVSFRPVKSPTRSRVRPNEMVLKPRTAKDHDALMNLLRSRLTGRRRKPRAGQVSAEEALRSIAAMPNLMFRARSFFPAFPIFHPSEAPGRVVDVWPYEFFDILTMAGATLSAELQQLAYLGPLRAAPTRFQIQSGEIVGGVGTAGEHTPLFLARDPDLLREVNCWLQQLGIPYDLAIEPLSSDQVGLEIGDVLVTRLTDRRSGVAVTPQDVGFGVSQLLPIVAEVLSGRRRTICVEQPEIHIHPRLQAETADLLIAGMEEGRGNQVIVETHSEHLMLRLQRRLREGGAEWLSAEDVAVIYVDVDSSGRARPERLHLAEDGTFVDEWPNGFFSERVDELF